jgi:Uma2 family endonuclease
MRSAWGEEVALVHSQRRCTVQAYLALERAAEERHEYLDGLVYAMAGESPEHADICTNLVGELRAQLKGTPCRVRSKDTKVCSGPAPRHPRALSGLFSYPDIVVICDTPQYHDDYRDVVINPRLIIEVLSASTEAFDRGEKFRRYHLWNPTLTDYVLVSQAQPTVEHYVRQPDGGWSYYLYEGLDRSLSLTSIGCTHRLAEVYDRIVFPPAVPEGMDVEEQ